MFLHWGRYWSSNFFPEEQPLVSWSSSNTMLIWGFGGLPQEKFLRTLTAYYAGKCPLRSKERWEELSIKGNSCPSCPPAVTDWQGGLDRGPPAKYFEGALAKTRGRWRREGALKQTKVQISINKCANKEELV